MKHYTIEFNYLHLLIAAAFVLTAFGIGYSISYGHGYINGIEFSLEIAKKYLNLEFDTNKLAIIIQSWRN